MSKLIACAALLAVAAAGWQGATATPYMASILLDNWQNGGGGTWTGANFSNPSATTDGALWIQKASSGSNTSGAPLGHSPVWLDEDVNLQLAANIPGAGWTNIGTALLGNGTAAGDVTGSDWPPSYGGYFRAGVGSSPGQYNLGTYNSNPGPLGFEIWAWSGNYSSFAAAIAAGAYVADSGVFSNPVNWGPTSSAYGFSNMPAMVLKPALLGDANLDGAIDVSDLSKVLVDYNKSGMTWGQGDFDGNGIVNVSDLSILLPNYNRSVAAVPAVTSLPEPSSFALLGAAAVALIGYAWRRLRLTRTPSAVGATARAEKRLGGCRESRFRWFPMWQAFLAMACRARTTCDRTAAAFELGRRTRVYPAQGINPP